MARGMIPRGLCLVYHEGAYLLAHPMPRRIPEPEAEPRQVEQLPEPGRAQERAHPPVEGDDEDGPRHTEDAEE